MKKKSFNEEVNKVRDSLKGYFNSAKNKIKDAEQRILSISKILEKDEEKCLEELKVCLDEDGEISHKVRCMLDRFRNRLRISEERALEIEKY